MTWGAPDGMFATMQRSANPVAHSVGLWIGLAALPALGCGASMAELARDGRWYDACTEQLEADPDEWDGRGRYLMGEMARQMTGEVSSHVFTVRELEEVLPYVPTRLASREVVLMATEVRYEAGDLDVLWVGAKPETDRGASEGVSCCEPGPWMALDGRAAEWAAMREAQEAAERHARERRERYAGPWGLLRAMAEMGAGLSADLTFIATAGAIDVDVSSLPGARASPIQLARAIAARVRESVTNAHSAATPSGTETEAEAELAMRRAESLAILAQLLDGPATCRVELGGECRTMGLYEVGSGATVTTIATKISGELDGEGGDCAVGTTVVEGLGDSEGSRAISALVPPVRPPTE